MPSAPSYRWVCHRCHAVNESGAAVCTQCARSALARADEITPRPQNEPAAHSTAPPPTPPAAANSTADLIAQTVGSNLLLFMPEMALAVAAVLFTPIHG